MFHKIQTWPRKKREYWKITKRGKNYPRGNMKAICPRLPLHSSRRHEQREIDALVANTNKVANPGLGWHQKKPHIQPSRARLAKSILAPRLAKTLSVGKSQSWVLAARRGGKKRNLTWKDWAGQAWTCSVCPSYVTIISSFLREKGSSKRQ